MSTMNELQRKTLTNDLAKWSGISGLISKRRDIRVPKRIILSYIYEFLGFLDEIRGKYKSCTYLYEFSQC